LINDKDDNNELSFITFHRLVVVDAKESISVVTQRSDTNRKNTSNAFMSNLKNNTVLSSNGLLIAYRCETGSTVRCTTLVYSHSRSLWFYLFSHAFLVHAVSYAHSTYMQLLYRYLV